MLQSNPSIYSAGKVYNAERFRKMRALGYNVRARWIDMSDEAALNKTLLWELCHRDASDADMVIIYCHKWTDYLLGSIVEAGHVMGRDKPVYSINDCIHTVANKVSDCAYTAHPLWTKILNNDSSYVEITDGYRRAMSHYVANFWDNKKLPTF